MNDFLDPTAWVVLSLLLSTIVLLGVAHLRRRSEPAIQVREIPALSDLQDELGQAAETGKPLHIALGNGGIGSPDTATSLAGLEILEGLVDAAIAYDVVPVVTVGDPTLLPLAQDVLRRAYERSQIPEFYDPGQVRFIVPSPLAYAAGAVPLGAPEDLTANVAVGTFTAEVALIADAGERRGIVNVGAVDSAQAIGALYPATDRLAVGEELYAAGAQLTQKEKYTTSLITEDILRVLVTVAILGAAILALIRG